jgi:quinol monooxygenase YgiN
MIVVAGHLRLRPGTFKDIRQHMHAMISASRAEKGCLAYSYGRDIGDPNTVRVFELWQSPEDLDRHLASPHLKAWRAHLAEIDIEEREISAYAAGNPHPI